MTKRKEEARRRALEMRMSETRRKLEKKIVEPAMAEHNYDFHHPAVESARRVVNATLERIYSSPSCPLPLEVVLRLAQSGINSDGFVDPPTGWP